MNKYGIVNTHEALHQKMLQYIKTIYLGKNHALRGICSEELEEPLSLSQHPHIEANPTYEVVRSGIFSISDDILPADTKSFYQKLIDNKMGVFKDPYAHQVTALEGYFSGNDLLVATGTGSGKTECFMWPIVGKLYTEARFSPQTWETRGVRALMLYPMNALVSDQMGRLRKMVGDEKGIFESLFTELNGRRPQFGMYTGRTSYSGKQSPEEDKKLAKTLDRNLVSCSDNAKKQLKKLGKYPAKSDLGKFVQKLKQNEHYTSPHDAELLTRQEMQVHCPDILITNYSMLEYMLLRPMEAKIWENTKRWLQSNPDNKLLFIIDEAHMYRGSSGGEVALLIRRLMNRLEIGRDRIQFILTTASVPSQDMEGVQKFACNLSSNSDPSHEFQIVKGTPEKLDHSVARNYPAAAFSEIDIDAVLGDPFTKAQELEHFAKALSLPHDGIDFTDERQSEIWLYDTLKKIEPVLKMIEKCRGNATKLEELAKHAFPDDNVDVATAATSVLLAIAPQAKSKEGNVLFPARVHMMFRGLRGLYMCSNPMCSCKQQPENNTLPFGRVYISQKRETCECGAKVYELLNDRSCGALFFRGYLDTSAKGVKYIWTSRGVVYNENMHEVHFYILNRKENFNRKSIPNGQNVREGWLNSLNGRLYEDDSQADNPNCLRVVYYRPKDEYLWSFESCPHCRRRNFVATDFATKGNEPFFNLVSEQLSVQPQTLFGEEEVSNSPNKGRKVLIFSDSRQKAAILAKDLTRATDEDAMKKALTLSAKRLHEWATENGKDATMNLLYPFVVEIAYRNGLRFFYGDDEGLIQSHIEKFKEDLAFCEELEDPFDYAGFADTVSPPGLYWEQLLKQICSNYRSLSDVAFCWISPSNQTLKKSKVLLKRNGIDLTEEEYLQIYSAWAIDALTSGYSFGVDGVVTNEIRDNAAGREAPRGIKKEHEIKLELKKILTDTKHFTDSQLEIIKKCLLLTTVETDTKYFINPALVTLRYEPYPAKQWYVCPKCGKVAPFKLWGKCLHCKDTEARDMTQDDIEGLRFWRDPVENAIANADDMIMTGINAEEHTAQLSHKDELDSKMWSTTEDYEMRFQNVFVDNHRAKPVDVLSCTTTMEVGIDIGSLIAVGLRNIPPMRENYQQRAGRAGRRGAAVSSIVTYIDNGPHDNFYFDHPELIISGEPRTPWIDNANKKIVYRHLNIIVINAFLATRKVSMDAVPVDEFFNEYFADFIHYLEQKSFTDEEIRRLVPIGLESCAYDYKKGLEKQLSFLADQVREFPEKYKSNKGEMESLLDALYKEGIMPTYSFPKNVVGFHIEHSDGRSIKEKPERSLDIAITEYAPGRTIVVDKKTYTSGGLYSYHAKRACGKYDIPARKYLSGESTEYVKTLFLCQNEACQWFSTEEPENNTCPFCGGKKIDKKQMVKPWGFAPKNGTSIRESEAEKERSYAESPSYAATPSDPMSEIAPFTHVRIAKRANQQLLIVNKGVHRDGFIVCKDCGAAYPGKELDVLTKEKIQKPYVNPYSYRKCNHNPMAAYIGTDIRTDMVVFEFSIDGRIIDTGYDNGGLWIRQAAATLSEAMVLCAGRLLDVEFNEIKSGYRIRHDNDYTYLDVFLFDSLSSGAGYCSMVADSASKLLQNTLAFLESCTCERTCHKCLNHFWNQRVQDSMDRHAAIDLLRWCATNSLPDPLTERECDLLAIPVMELFNTDQTQGISICKEGNRYYVVKGTKRKQLYFYPAMWSERNSAIPQNAIPVANLMVNYSLPSVYNHIVENIDKDRHVIIQPDPRTGTKNISFRNGLDFTDETYQYIWDYVLDDIDDSANRSKIQTLKDSMAAGVLYEKPIYCPDVTVIGGASGAALSVDLLWPKSKIIMTFEADEESIEVLRESDWKIVPIDELTDTDYFLESIKE